MGRDAECERLDRLLADVRGGESRVLVLRGEAGIGKTALLDHLTTASSGCRVLAAAGVQSEMELPFAAVHQLCMPLLDRLASLPEPQRDALASALGMRTGPAPDQVLVGLAVLGLLAHAAEERPLLCVVDDAQWLDRASAQVFAFVSGRLLAEGVACVFAARDTDDVLPGLPGMDLGGLPDADARALLGRALRGPLDEQVRDRILAESRGNPLALVKLAGAASAGGYAASTTGRSLPDRIEDAFQRRLESLPADARMLLLLAAADPLGDPALLRRAAAVLGVDASAIDTPEDAPVADAPVAGRSVSDDPAAGGLIDVGGRVRFRHPLVRSAVYASAMPSERRRAHRALAEATDAATDPDRRAWHRAHGAFHPEEDIAAELARSAGRAQARGGLAAAAAFLERAAELTPDPGRRAVRALDAAQAKHLAGEPEPALALLAAADAGPPDEVLRARAESLRAAIAVAGAGDPSAPRALLAAAERLEPFDLELSRDTYLEALLAAIGVLPDWGGIIDVAALAREAPPAPDPPRAADLVLDALTRFYLRDTVTAEPAMRRAMAAATDEGASPNERLRWLWVVNLFAMALWDEDACRELNERHLRLARESGALVLLPLVLGMSALLLLFEGDLVEAEVLTEEAKASAGAADHWTATGAMAGGGDLGLAAWRGDEAETERLAGAIARRGEARGERRAVEIAHWARSVLHNGLGQYEKALQAALRAGVHHQAPGGCGVIWAPLELIEAAARTGRLDLASGALDRLSLSTRAGGAEWGLALEARCRALLSEGEEADRLYREAIDRLGRTRMRVDLARAHLLYGEWLRRERRRVEARENLRAAFDLFSGVGMRAFADRAARELQATGETAARGRDAEPAGRLTPQEAQVARLARAGLTNKEIAARLYVSPRTVEHHLHKVFTKLGVASRHQLGEVL
ncbi:AAA family ATPase [Actinomadura sp. WMMA1423]|uniref:ATP-binding protein n=1 Tax=Actinomadura sp. WMMA1423 TaxID=2591108 RepID=UPI001F0F552E|nr:LuxR family transcriptional regulator [Actinomadura sp. WMMA1423]